VGIKPRFNRGWFWAHRDVTRIVIRSSDRIPTDERHLDDTLLAMEKGRFFALFPGARIPEGRPVKIRLFAEVVDDALH
jgi:hypothetical protein